KVTVPPEPLGLAPRAKAGTPSPSPAQPSGAVLPVAHGSQFEIRCGLTGTVHLLTGEFEKQGYTLSLQKRQGEKFGPKRLIYQLPKKKASEDEGPFVGRTGFLVAPDEGFHVFVQVSEKDHQRLFYARVS